MKKSLIALLVMTVLTSCFSCKSFKINVNLDNSTEKTVYLSRFENGALTTIDSVVAKNNKAVFKMKKSDNNDALHIMMKGWRRPIVFFADNQDVIVEGDGQNNKGVKVTASETQQKLNEFMDEIDRMENEREIYYKAMDFVKQNIDNQVGAYALYRYKWAVPLQDLEALCDAMPKDMQSAYKTEVLNYVDGLKKTQPGMPYIDFTQNNLKGEPVALSSIVGKADAVIVDFWASWCPDCRKANPALVWIYDQFKDKGLDIVSVSLDTNYDEWLKATEKDNLKWQNHLSDLKGWNNEAAQMYMVAFIPQNVDIDKNGTIVGRNLEVAELHKLLSNILK